MASVSSLKTAVTAVTLGLLGTFLVSCGTGPVAPCSAFSAGSVQACDGPPHPSPGSSLLTTSPAGDPGIIFLKIRRTDQPGAAPVDLTLRCLHGKAQPESTVPDPAGACSLLTDKPQLLFPTLPTGQACDDRYGGPQKATVTGTAQGKAVSLELSRTDGCTTAQWDSLDKILGSAGGV